MKKLLSVALAAVTFAALSFTSCSDKSGNTIKIGGIAPLSGGVAVYGLECTDGVNLAVAEINAAGGILGKQVEYSVEDDEGDPAKSVNAYTKLTTQKGVGINIRMFNCSYFNCSGSGRGSDCSSRNSSFINRCWKLYFPCLLYRSFPGKNRW